MPNDSNELYAFDDFRLHAAERRLLYRNVQLPLPEKAFETLCVLVKNSNHLVTRETLLSEVWKDTIVEENNLAKNVSLLRKVLRSQADGREFIETVRGHGFRFTADVRVSSALEPGEDAALKAAFAAPQPGMTKDWSWPGRLVLAALLGTVLLLSYSAMSRNPAASSVESVAVLPFQNSGSDAELAYLSDALSEDLIDRLSELLPLRVISRHSSFKYRGENINLHEAASALGAGGIITGTVVRRGDVLSISVELTDARSNTHLWGDTFRSTLSDVVGMLEVQRNITRAVSRALRLKLTREQERRLYREYAPTAPAFEFLQRGRAERQKGRSGHQKAIDYFRKATEADPKYGLAFAELSLTYSIGIGVPDTGEALTKAEAAALRALELDDSLAEAHHSLGNIKMNRLDWAGAEDEFTRAIELNPSLARAHAGYSNILAVLGESERSLAERQKARELDPLLPRSDAQFGWALMGVGRVDEAIEVFKKSDFQKHYNLGAAYAVKRMYREAAAEFEQAIKVEGRNSPPAEVYLGTAYAKAGDIKKARAILRQIDSDTRHVSPTERAALLDALGDRDAAFAALNKAFEDRDPQLQSLKDEIFFEGIRSDPRFHELLKRVGLPQ